MQKIYKIAEKNSPELFSKISGEMALYLPIKNSVDTKIESTGAKTAPLEFSQWRESSGITGVDFATLKTAVAPKQFFLSSHESLYSATAKDGEIEITPPSFEVAPFVLFGVRACDAKGIEVLDSVYLGEPADKFYESRRNAATIITMACNAPNATCFCASFGIDPAAPKGDVSTWLVDGFLYWQANTEKGEALTAVVESVSVGASCVCPDVNDCDSPSSGRSNAVRPYEAVNQSDTIPFSHFHPDNLLEIFNSPNWDELHRTCLACGTCTYICPTCQCYDIGSFDSGRCVKFHRCHDSCMYSDFTQMAHGNPRPSHKERFRQRFMHKLVYHPKEHGGTFGCVGCGRCTNKCPANISIAKIARCFHV